MNYSPRLVYRGYSDVLQSNKNHDTVSVPFFLGECDGRRVSCFHEWQGFRRRCEVTCDLGTSKPVLPSGNLKDGKCFWIQRHCVNRDSNSRKCGESATLYCNLMCIRGAWAQ